MSRRVSRRVSHCRAHPSDDQFVDLVCLHKVSEVVKNIAGLEARLEHFRKLDGVRSALARRGAKVKELTPYEVDERAS